MGRWVAGTSVTALEAVQAPMHVLAWCPPFGGPPCPAWSIMPVVAAAAAGPSCIGQW
jgi:hypothetical protein